LGNLGETSRFAFAATQRDSGETRATFDAGCIRRDIDERGEAPTMVFARQ
jgi:hypothetical protein